MLPPITSSDVRLLSQATGALRWRGATRALQRATVLLAAFALVVLAGRAESRLRTILDDWRYGMPRTAHLDAPFGHVTVMNQGRQVIILQVPPGDPSGASVVVGPYLFGPGGDTAPVIPSAHDIDGDGAQDLLLRIDREIVVYLSRDGALVLPTPEDRARFQLPSGEAIQ